MTERVWQQCIAPDCSSTYSVDQFMPGCPKCGNLLDILYDPDQFAGISFDAFTRRRAQTGVGIPEVERRLNASGIWRFRELLPFYDRPQQIVTVGEGQTLFQDACGIAQQIGHKPGRLFLQYEGFNPSGSFKDNGMTAAFTHANMIGARRVACASTGNTSASLAMFAQFAAMQAYVFIGSGRIAYGKLSQALDYGAKTIQIDGDFDACLRRVRQVVTEMPELGVYLMNSVNAFRLEGQKTIMYRILEGLGWQVPDWIIVPGGNLGNASAFGKAFHELHELGMIDRMPRLAIIQAAGADPLDELVNQRGLKWNDGQWDQSLIDHLFAERQEKGIAARTIASAIEIGRPVNLPKALRALHWMNGVVRKFDDPTILEYKAMIGKLGYGCEPSSAAAVAGAHQLLREGVIDPNETVACVLTGHQLKDPDATVQYHTGVDMKAMQSKAPRQTPTGRIANQPIQVPDDLDAILEAMNEKTPAGQHA